MWCRWQAEALPHSRGHYGQILLVHELLRGGAFEALAVPAADHGRFGLGYGARQQV